MMMMKIGEPTARLTAVRGRREHVFVFVSKKRMRFGF